MNIILWVDHATLLQQQKAIADVKVAGLTLLQRAVRAAEIRGHKRIFIAAPLGYVYKKDPKVKADVRVITYEDSENAFASVYSRIAENDGDDWLICRINAYLTPSLLPASVSENNVTIHCDDKACDIFVLSRASAANLQNTSSEAMHYAAPGILKLDGKYLRIISADDVRKTANAISDGLRKPLSREADGLVAYFINRRISLQISKRIANTPITPNMITAFGLVLGLVAALSVATTLPALIVTGGILWQLSSIIDGVDGELARMRLAPSHSGEWFDTVADDVTNITFLAALSYNMAFIHAEPLYAYAGYVICALTTVAVLLFYAEFVRRGIASHNHFVWGFESEMCENKKISPLKKILDKIAIGFAWLAKRDSYTFIIMLLLIFRFDSAAYWVMTIGCAFVAVGGLWQNILIRIRRDKACENNAST